MTEILAANGFSDYFLGAAEYENQSNIIPVVCEMARNDTINQRDDDHRTNFVD